MDHVMHGSYLREFAPRIRRQIVVLNRSDLLSPADASRVAEDMRGQLRRDGAGDIEVVATRAKEGAGGIDELRKWLESGVEAKRVVVSRVAAEAREAVRDLAADAGVVEGTNDAARRAGPPGARSLLGRARRARRRRHRGSRASSRRRHAFRGPASRRRTAGAPDERDLPADRACTDVGGPRRLLEPLAAARLARAGGRAPARAHHVDPAIGACAAPPRARRPECARRPWSIDSPRLSIVRWRAKRPASGCPRARCGP